MKINRYNTKNYAQYLSTWGLLAAQKSVVPWNLEIAGFMKMCHIIFIIMRGQTTNNGIYSSQRLYKLEVSSYFLW